MMDKKLGPVLPPKPEFIYKKASNYGDRIVKKVLDPPAKPKTFWDQNGFFACRKCKPCREVTNIMRGIEKFTCPVNNAEFDIDQFITCNTDHVVYALKCPCNLIYIGRTKRKMRIRVMEHINNIKLGYEDHNVSLHFKLKHNQDPSGLQFWGIQHIMQNWRGGHRVRELSKSETRWIFLTESLAPKGMNIELDINCFISDA